MTADVELPAILRDIAAARRNSVGDYWSRDYCSQAAAEIERLRAEREVIVAEAVKYAGKSGRLEAKVDRLAEALKDLEVCANTIDCCYTRNPGNFAVALRELRESAERSRDALRDSEAASA